MRPDAPGSGLANTEPGVPAETAVKKTERPHPLTPLIRGWVVFVAIATGPSLVPPVEVAVVRVSAAPIVTRRPTLEIFVVSPPPVVTR